MRLVYLLSGLSCVAIGGVGVLVPGLPTTIFFIMAAWCFSRSSRRLERWVLNLPGIGPMVSDYRDGLGMPRRAKVFAISCIVIAVSISAGLLIGNTAVRLVVVGAGLVGMWYVGLRVPTRETVLAERAAAGASRPDQPADLQD
ncbi:MAG: YbaN family protein [Acidimicrobiales bacterium]